MLLCSFSDSAGVKSCEVGILSRNLTEKHESAGGTEVQANSCEVGTPSRDLPEIMRLKKRSLDRRERLLCVGVVCSGDVILWGGSLHRSFSLGSVCNRLWQE